MFGKALLSILTNTFNLLATFTIVLPALCGFSAWKLLVIGVARVIWKDKVSLMRGQDSMFTLRPNGATRNMAVVAWMVMRGNVTKEELGYRLNANILHNPDASSSRIYRY
jgi:hypothetical protein